MVPTIAIGGSENVLAPLGRPGEFYQGKRQWVEVTAVSPDEQTPLNVRQALVGVRISTIFTKDQLPWKREALNLIPDGSRLAYAQEVIEALKHAGEHEAAADLAIVAGNPLDMYILEPDIYELVDDE